MSIKGKEGRIPDSLKSRSASLLTCMKKEKKRKKKDVATVADMM